MDRLASRAVEAVVVVATVLVLVAVGVAPFFTPAWIFPAQDRTGSQAWTGWSADQVHSVTGSVLHDLLIGPPDFAQTIDGQPVFDEAEVAHLRDVRRVVLIVAAAAVVAAIIVVVAWRLMRPRSRFWRSVQIGARVLGVGVVALGVFSVVAFDAAFELFHRLFFAPGTYTFDPATSHLVQLFPEEFWYQTAIAIGVWLIVIAVVVHVWAGVRASAAVGVVTDPAGEALRP